MICRSLGKRILEVNDVVNYCVQLFGEFREPLLEIFHNTDLKGLVIGKDSCISRYLLNQSFAYSFTWILSWFHKVFIVLWFGTLLFDNMKRILKRDLLIRPCAVKRRHGLLERLKVKKTEGIGKGAEKLIDQDPIDYLVFVDKSLNLEPLFRLKPVQRKLGHIT